MEPQVACRFAGVEIAALDADASVRTLLGFAAGSEGVAVHLCNAYTLALAAKEPSFADVLQHRACNLADGVPVGWFSQLQTGRRRLGPVRGPTLMRRALEQPGLRHFFLGGDRQLLDRLAEAARRIRPDLVISGSLAPPFAPLTPESILEWSRVIEASGANIVWVGLGTPKQDHAIAQLVDRVAVPLVGVGAAFDFLAGTKREAPELLRGTGFEWLYRLACEPRRLWRRYLIGNARFLVAAGGQLIRDRPHVGEATPARALRSYGSSWVPRWNWKRRQQRQGDR